MNRLSPTWHVGKRRSCSQGIMLREPTALFPEQLHKVKTVGECEGYSDNGPHST